MTRVPSSPVPSLERSVGEALDMTAGRVRAAGVAGPRREVELLMAHALGVELGTVLAYPERTLSDAESAAFDGMVDARVARMPLSRILGRREFWSLPFDLSPAVLDPRPDSETVVRAVLDRVPDRGAPRHVLDLGTGSGCLLLALLHELPRARGVGLERDPAAAAVARANAAALDLAERVDIRHADWRGDIDERFDVIVCNPPYVPSDEIGDLAPEVSRHDPHDALDGGIDGLDAYRALAPRLAGWLAPGGLAVLEVGQGQAEAVIDLFRRSGLHTPPPMCDLAGVPRCVLALRDDR